MKFTKSHNLQHVAPYNFQHKKYDFHLKSHAKDKKIFEEIDGWNIYN